MKKLLVLISIFLASCIVQEVAPNLSFTTFGEAGNDKAAIAAFHSDYYVGALRERTGVRIISISPSGYSTNRDADWPVAMLPAGDYEIVVEMCCDINISSSVTLKATLNPNGRYLVRGISKAIDGKQSFWIEDINNQKIISGSPHNNESLSRIEGLPSFGELKAEYTEFLNNL